jgi:hypothetical protein
MKLAILSMILAIAVASVLWADPPSTQPNVNSESQLPATTQPSSRPAGVTVRGHIAFSAGLDLQKPDPSRTVIYLSSDPSLDAFAGPPPHAVMAQRNKAFTPSFLVVPCNTEVEFPNWDHFYHNVFSRSAAAPAFDLERYPYGWAKTRTFTKVGVVQLFCNIHPDMHAVIFVTPNAFFTRADADGRFELANVPPGNHELVVWQERCQEQRRRIDVDPNATLELSFTLDQSRSSIMANDAPRRDSSYGVERGLNLKRDHLDLPVVPDAHPAVSKDQPENEEAASH